MKLGLRALVATLSIMIAAGASAPAEAKVPACGKKQQEGGGDHTGPWRLVVFNLPSQSVRPQVEQAATKRCAEYGKKKICLRGQTPRKLEFICYN